MRAVCRSKLLVVHPNCQRRVTESYFYTSYLRWMNLEYFKGKHKPHNQRYVLFTDRMLNFKWILNSDMVNAYNVEINIVDCTKHP